MGNTIDFMLSSENEKTIAAKRFFGKVLSSNHNQISNNSSGLFSEFQTRDTSSTETKGSSIAGSSPVGRVCARASPIGATQPVENSKLIGIDINNQAILIDLTH